MSFFCDLREPVGRPFGGTRTADVHVAPGATLRPIWGENLMLARVELEPHVEVPNHAHPHEQGGLVLEGEGDFTIGGERRWIGPGDAYLIPGGVQHHLLVGDKPMLILDIFTPPREEYKPVP